MYTPLSADVYNAAFNGALTGCLSGRLIVDTVLIDYQHITRAALAFAQAFDTTFNGSNLRPISSATANAIEELSRAAFETRYPADVSYETPSAYQPTVNGIMAVLQESALCMTAAVTPGGNIPPALGYAGFFTGVTAGSNALSAVTVQFVESLVSGSKVWTMSFFDSWTWQPDSVATSDGVTVYNPPSNPNPAGRFTRDMLHSLKWAEQVDWYIDPSTGNDENTGADNTHPLQSMGEYLRRVSKPAQAQNVHILNNVPGTDTVNGSLTANGGPLKFIGLPTVLHTGTLTTVTVQNRATQTPNSVTDTATDFSAYSGKLMIITGSANPAHIGLAAWIVKDNGGHSARVSPWAIQQDTTFAKAFSVRLWPSAGDAYEIVDFPYMNVSSVTCVSNSTNDYGVLFSGFNLEVGGNIVQGLGNVFTDRCKVDGGLWFGGGFMYNSCLLGPSGALPTFMAGSGWAIMSGCVIGASASYIVTNGNLTVDRDFIIQTGVGFLVAEGGMLLSGTMCCFDLPAIDTPAIDCHVGATWYSHPYSEFDLAELFWGTSNGNAVAKFVVDSKLVYSVKPTCTGSTGKDFILNGASKTWASDCPFADATNQIFGIVRTV